MKKLAGLQKLGKCAFRRKNLANELEVIFSGNFWLAPQT